MGGKLVRDPVTGEQVLQGAGRALNPGEMQTIHGAAKAAAAAEGVNWATAAPKVRQDFINRAAGGEVVERGGQLYLKENEATRGAA